MTLIKSLNLRFLIWKMGSMMILFNLLDCMCTCKEQVALRGLSGLLSLEQIRIILPPGEKEVFCLEVMGAIPKAKY